MGYDRNPMAGLKYRGNLEDEDFEVTTWAYRESDNSLIPDPLAFWQTHVFVFDNGDGTFDLYAHYEYSSMNPLVAYKHVRGIGMDRERGVGYVLRNLEQNSGLDVVDVAGMWGPVTEAAPER
ncbi:hypothetical protein [Natronorubrum sulfidifaciens]|nr:hypothetical protein [Natronorubrum sulfidifaciens]